MEQFVNNSKIYGRDLHNLTDVQAAIFLNLSPQTLRNYRCQGRGPAYCRIGRRAIRYRRQDLEAFINRNRIDPEAR